MHDRYFFAADVISIIFAFYSPRHFYIPVVIGMSSFLSYFPYLFGKAGFLPYLAVAMLAVIIALVREFLITASTEKTSPKTREERRCEQESNQL